MCLYVILDSICLVYMSLATYCVIKLCLTSTFKANLDPLKGEWTYSSYGVPHRMRRIIITIILLPIVIVHDICFQVLYRDKVAEFFGKDTQSDISSGES